MEGKSQQTFVGFHEANFLRLRQHESHQSGQRVLHEVRSRALRNDRDDVVFDVVKSARR